MCAGARNEGTETQLYYEVMGPSMPPISFTDSQLEQVLVGAAPLHTRDHAAYLQAVADLLQGISEPGDTDVHRAVREA